MPRYANRIRNGTFTIPISKDASGPNKFFVPRNAGSRSLNRRLLYKYSSADAGNNTLHGGFKGYDRRVWKLQNSSPNSATFILLDPAGTEGFPGTVSTTVSYLFSRSSNLINNENWKGYLYFRMQCNMEYQHQRRCFSGDTHNAYWSLLLEP